MQRSITQFASFAAMFAVTCMIGCGSESDSGGSSAPSGGPSYSEGSSGDVGTSNGGGTAVAEAPMSRNATAVPAAIRAGKVEFRVGEGVEVGSFKPKGESAVKYYDRDGNELCKLTFDGRRLKVKSADDKPLFELKAKDSKVMLKDASGEKELFKFKIKGRNIDFYAPGDKRLYRLRQKDYGYALEDNNDKTLFRAKKKDGRIVLRDLADKTVLYSNDLKQPLALPFFRMKELTPEQQAACSLYFLANAPR